MMTSTADIQTQQAQRLISRLCKHWGHKFPIRHNDQQAEIELPLGVCRLRGGSVLRAELEGDAAQMPTFQQVVADHLQRMAGKEDLVVEWQS